MTHEASVTPVTEVPQMVLSMRVPTPMRETSLMSLIERYVRDPSIDIAKLEGMVALQERLMRWEAETAWNTAMAEAQSEMRAVSRDSPNPQTHSRYASYAAIDAVLRPIYSKHGFALTFNTEPSPRESCIVITCTVAKGGHGRHYQIDMPADGKGARGNDVMTKTHATGSAVTYGMRYLVTMIFNVAMTDDDGYGAGRNDARDANPPKRPPQPAPNVMLPQNAMHDIKTGDVIEGPAAATSPAVPLHDPETGEIIDADPADMGEDQSDLIRRYDAALAEAAEQGTAKLSAVWRAIPKSSHKILMAAKDTRYKPRAAEVDSASAHKPDRRE